MSRFLKSGDGWRVGWHPQALKYQGLIGADNWAIELTKAELDDFCRLLNQLVNTMREMEAELMDEERISCEAQSDRLWLEAEGYPHSYTLRIILNGDRRCEGNWTEGTAPKIVAALNCFDFT